jgi:anti-sigma regulatory factor (Ser/Thr protein kinase)
MPSLESERGRGLFLLSVYLEELRAAQAPDGGLCLSGRIQHS